MLDPALTEQNDSDKWLVFSIMVLLATILNPLQTEQQHFCIKPRRIHVPKTIFHCGQICQICTILSSDYSNNDFPPYLLREIWNIWCGWMIMLYVVSIILGYEDYFISHRAPQPLYKHFRRREHILHKVSQRLNRYEIPNICDLWTILYWFSLHLYGSHPHVYCK